MLKKLLISFIVIAALIISYPLFLRDKILWVVNNTALGHMGIELLQKTGIYDHQSKIQKMDATYILALYQLMKDVHDVFEVAGVPYWADGGTLLGAIRHKGLIPWDDDLDIQISKDDYPLFEGKALPLLKKLGYEFARSKIIVPAALYPNLDKVQPPSCDIFVAEKKERKLDIGWTHAIDIKDHLPLKLQDFGGFKIWIHRNPTPYLDALYGKNWGKQAWRGVDHYSENEGEKSSMVPFHLEKKSMLPAQPTGPLKDNRALIEGAFNP